MHARARVWTLMASTLGFAVLGAVQAAPAHACSCSHFGHFGHFPRDGATGVATDLRLLEETGYIEEFLDERPTHLLGPDAETIDIDWRKIEEAQLHFQVGFPSRELDPHTTYEVVMPQGVTRSFTTGGSAAETPEVPAEVDRKTRYLDVAHEGLGIDCSSDQAWVGVSLEYDPGLVLVTVDPAEFDAQRLEGRINGLSAHDYFQVGRAPCTDNWEGAGPGASTPIHVGVLDENGHFSGWVAFDDAQIPSEGRCSLNPDVPAEGGLLGLALLGLVRRVRRR